VCALYNNYPQFICCSATIANPLQHAQSLTGLEFTSVTHTSSLDGGGGSLGSPGGDKHFVIWNPPILPDKRRRKKKKTTHTHKHNATSTTTHKVALPIWLPSHTARRASTHFEAARVLYHLIKQNFKTICFCKTRTACELVLQYTQELLERSAECSHLSELVKTYRGGYNPEERRAIERALFSGRLRAVVATNALELG